MIALSITVNVGRIEYGLTDTDLGRIRKSQANNSTRVLMDSFTARGGRSYWGTAAKATTAVVQGDEVLLRIKHPGVMLHWRGGTVRPGRNDSSKTGKPTKALSIPADDLIDRVAPGGFGGLLAFQPAKHSRKLIGMLVDGESKPITQGPNKGKMHIVPTKSGAIRYYLAAYTEHTADPSVIPVEQIAEAAAASTRQYLTLITRTK